MGGGGIFLWKATNLVQFGLRASITPNVWISAAHVPGKRNIMASRESRCFDLDAEWKMDDKALCAVLGQLGVWPEIKLFASRVNTQMDGCVFHKHNQEVVAFDAFSLSWEHTVLCFPAFQPCDCQLHGQWRSISTERSPDAHRGPSFVKKWRLQYNYLRKVNQVE